MSTSDEDYEAEAARQAAETCEHGVSLSEGPACRKCEDIPAGWVTAGCAYCQAAFGPKCQKGGCCTGCRHSVLPPGRGSRMVRSKHSSRLVPEIFDLETGEAI